MGTPRAGSRFVAKQPPAIKRELFRSSLGAAGGPAAISALEAGAVPRHEAAAFRTERSVAYNIGFER